MMTDGVLNTPELWDLYDRERRPLNRTMQRGTPTPAGTYHLAVEIWTVNGRGQMLLTRRHPKKKFGGMWESTGGAVVAGENSLQGALRELAEEVGLVVPAQEMHLLGSEIGTDWMLDTYLVLRDVPLEVLHLQAEEVIDAMWADEKTLLQLSREGKFVPSALRRYTRYAKQIIAR